MCDRCQTVFDLHFPVNVLTSDERDYILWNLTAFPFADPEYFEKQVTELAAFVKPGTEGWWGRINVAEENADKAMRTVNRLFGKKAL